MEKFFPKTTKKTQQLLKSQFEYRARNKKLRKIHKAASEGDAFAVQHLLVVRACGVNDRDGNNRWTGGFSAGAQEEQARRSGEGAGSGHLPAVPADPRPASTGSAPGTGTAEHPALSLRKGPQDKLELVS